MYQIDSESEFRRHDLSNPFGEADAKDFDELVHSMLTRGYDSEHPIVIYEGAILDGWHRYLAAKKANVSALGKDFTGTREDAQAFVWAENMARRQMDKRQKMAALVLVNAWRGPDEQMSDAEIAVRAGLSGSGRLAAQLRAVNGVDPGSVHDVAVGKQKASPIIRRVLHEEAAGDDNSTSPDAKRPSVVFELKQKRLIDRSHNARLSVGMAKQSFFNKAIELACEWAEAQSMPNSSSQR